MINIARNPDVVKIICDDITSDTEVRFVLCPKKMHVFVKATNDKVKFIALRWKHTSSKKISVLGDAFERSYGDLEWRGLTAERFMPWYFIAKDDEDGTVGCGVMVQPNSFVSFEYDAGGVTAWLDLRSGGMGVDLGGEELLAATIVCKYYKGQSPFDAATDFCKLMSPSPRLPKEPVYGGNNWYYAYGKSSREEIIEDAKFQSFLAKGNENRPFMVIDDGWSVNNCAGPWEPRESFGDMATLAEEFKSLGVRPGIWVRLLSDPDLINKHPDWAISRPATDGQSFLDPTHPDVKVHLREVLKKIKEWGYELIKHDFSTHDLFGHYGIELVGAVTKLDDWSFYDKTRTNAQVVLDFYKLIREAVGDMIIIGCNTVSHLCAGLVEINRIGDDTSGMNWNRTRAMGVNTLAFRLPQNNSFYKIDADCVGIMNNNIPWSLNKQWLELLSLSGSPLFVSCPSGVLNDEQIEQMKKAYRISSVQTDVAVPLDWEYNAAPSLWQINGDLAVYDWYEDTIPELLQTKYHP